MSINDELLLKCLQGHASADEYREAYLWIHANEQNTRNYILLRDAWVASGIITRENESDCNRVWKKVARRTGINIISIPPASSWRSIAAVFLFALFAGALGYHYIFTADESFSSREFYVKAPLGSKTNIVLPDNTEIWLNAGSELTLSTKFGKSDRNVHLTGEAFFEINSENNFPFRVYASDLVVHALGTAFNVKAYTDEEVIETTLVTGLAKIERTNPHGGTEEVLLKPNQRACFTRIDNVIKVTDISDEKEISDEESVQIPPFVPATVVENVDVEVYTSWKDKRFVFQGEKMSDLAAKLERIYDVNIDFVDKELADYRLTGSLEQETLEQLLFAIRLTIPLDFSIKQNTVFLTLNEQLKEKYEKISN